MDHALRCLSQWSALRWVLMQLLVSAQLWAAAPVPEPPPSGAISGQLITSAQAATATMLMQRALQANRGYAIVESLTTEVGPRLAGTGAEARARQWAVATLKDLGFSKVRIEPFQVPRWVRGVESAAVVAPFPQALTITALGGSAATPAEGIEAEVVSFDSLEALKQAPADSLRGRIVYIDEVMTRTQDGSGYGVAVAKRRETAFVAGTLGASAALIRSVGTSSHRFAHAGQMHRVDYEGETGVPTAALAAPDADQLRRILERGQPVVLKLIITPQLLPPAQSGNVIAEIPGSVVPGEIVLVGAHLDSWDLGTGAVDDGAGVGIVIGAASLLLEQLPRAPRRTIRVVLFGAEEVGLVGAEAYAQQHVGELARHVIATESDFGAGDIWRFDTGVAEDKVSLAQALGAALRPLGVGPGSNSAQGGPDMFYLKQAGVPVVGLKQNGWDYFDLHHTADDTLDKIAPAALNQNIAAYAAFLFLAADSEMYFR
jgi:Peptidase family M28